MKKLYLLVTILLFGFAEIFAGNIISNGDFQLGSSLATSYWSESTSAPGVQTVSIDNTSAITGSTNSIKIVVTTTASPNPITRLGVYQGVSLPKSSTYTVTFKAKSSATTTIQSYLHKSFDNFSSLANSNSFTLNAGVETTCSFDITSSSMTTGLCKLGFYYGLAPNGTTINIDDVTMVEKNPLTQFNLCNGDFETSMSNAIFSPTNYTYNGLTTGTPNTTENQYYYGWSLIYLTAGTPRASATLETGTPLAGSQSIKITSTGTASATPNELQFAWVYGATLNKNYVVTFKAKASQDYTLNLTMAAWDWLTSASTAIAETSCDLKTFTQTFSYVTSASYLSDAATVGTRNVLRFLLGTLPNGVSVYIDDVVVMEKQTPVITFTQDLSGLLTGQNTVALTSSANFDSSSTPAASTITYASDNNAVVSVSGTTLTVVGAGTCNVTASQAANSYYYAATSVSVPVTVTARPTLTVSGSQTDAVLNNVNYDVTVDGTLTMGANKTVHNLTVSSGGKITFHPSTPYTLTVTGNVVFKSDATTSFSSYLGAGGMSVSGTVSYDKTMDGTQWYFMSFPCDINMTTTPIKKADGTALTVGTNIFIKYYDGSSRASNLGASSNWVSMAAGSTLTKYKGYIFGLPTGQGPYDVRFPLTNALVLSEAANPVDVVAYGDGTAVAAIHKGWNLVGYPYISKYTATGANVNYMTLFAEGYYFLTLSKADVGLLSPFTAYFVQADAALEASKITFADGSRQQVHSAVATDLSDRVRINIVSPTGVDNTTLIIDDNQSADYQIGQDMVKWMTTATSKPQLYSVLNGDNYAYNALPFDNVQALPLGVYSNTSGECTISVDASLAPGLSQLLLTDNSSGVVTDLITSDYHFTASAGTNNSRFVLKAQRLTTQTITREETAEGPKIVSKNGKLLVSGISSPTFIRVYDARGSILASFNTTTNVEIPLQINGVCTVKMTSGTNSWVKKCLAVY
jgi:hypothetical protein